MAVLVLDVDGVVVRGHPEGGRWDRHIERDLGIAPAALQEHFFAPHWPAIMTGKADMRGVLDGMWHRLDGKAPPHAFIDYWFAADSKLDDDVLAQVDTWRAAGNTAYLATVQEHNRADYLWRTLGLAHHFDDILYSAALGAAKPDAAFFERVFAELPVTSPDEIIFLDDSLKNVEAAAAQGWHARHFRTADDLRAALAEA